MQPSVLPQEWLYNPVVYSQISGDFSLMQQRVLTGVLAALQERIFQAIRIKERDRQFPSLFPDSETMGEVVELEIDPRTMGVTPDHYIDLEEALNALAKLTVRYPKYVRGAAVWVIAPLFGRIEMPRGEIRRTGRVRITMLRRNVEDFFSLAHGYTVHLARITRICSRKRTPRLYIFLSSFADIGHKEVGYQDFCKFLGIDQETFELDNRAGGKVVKENPFRKWNKVRSQILDPSKMEMDTFCEAGEIDFTFRYEAIYNKEGGKGNPDGIRFFIDKGRLADEREQQTADRRKRAAFADRMCQWCPDLNDYELRQLINRVPPEYLDDVTDYGYRDVRRAVEQTQPDDVAAYCMTLLTVRVRKAEREARERREAAEILLRQGQWQACREELTAKAPDEKTRTAFASLDFDSWNAAHNTLMLSAPDNETVACAESDTALPFFARALAAHLGKVRLQYRITQPE